MLAKLSQGQLTLPEAVIRAIGEVEYFDVSEVEGRLVLTPLRISRADAVRIKLEELSIAEADVRDAISWARPR